jgi:hypothetical protein
MWGNYQLKFKTLGALGEFTSENRRTTCDKKIVSNIFIIGKFCKKCKCKIGDLKIVKHVYM